MLLTFHCCKSNLGEKSENDDKLQFLMKSIIHIYFSCADQIIDIASNIITSFKQQNPDERQQLPPIVLNCISGGAERSGLMTLGVSAIFAAKMRKPTLLSELMDAYIYVKLSSFIDFFQMS